VWNSNNNKIISNEEMIEFLKEYVSRGYHIYVGTDSQSVQEKYIFATAICVYHPEKRSGGRYVWKKKRYSRKDFFNLKQRIIEEATLTLTEADMIREKLPNASIEVHFDVSNEEKYKSNESVSVVTSYAKGYGFKFKIKPDSWAASGAADNHCKR